MQQPSPVKERKRIPLYDLRAVVLAWSDEFYRDRAFHAPRSYMTNRGTTAIIRDRLSEDLTHDPHALCDHDRNICHPKEHWVEGVSYE
jgi:hypothetical protein